MEFDSLQTDRLTLRAFEKADIPALVPLIGTREVAATTLRIPHPYTEADAIAYITSARENRLSGDELRLAIVLRDTSELCGGIGLRIEPEHRRAELGYWIGIPYWNRGIATEAARALVTYGFESLNLNRIFAGYVSTNLASASVLKKIGMRYEGCQRSHSVKWGEFLDIELYSMLAADPRPEPSAGPKS